MKTFTCWVPGPDGKKEKKKITVRYDGNRDNFFAIAPAHFADELRGEAGSSWTAKGGLVEKPDPTYGRISGATPKTVQKYFERSCENYCDAITKRRKVIVYSLKWCGLDSYSLDGGGIHFEKGKGIIIDWQVGWELKLVERTTYYHKDPIANPTLCTNSIIGGSDYKAIDWTQDREDFFAGLDRKLEKLIERSREFLGDDKKLVKLLDAGQGALLLGHDPKK